MINIDWGLIQLQYEYFGYTVEELAKEYDTTPRMIEYAAKEKGWQVNELALSCQDYGHLRNITQLKSGLLDQINDHMRVMHSLKQSALNPRYIALETALLGKCLELLQHTQADDPSSVTSLRAVADIFKSLKEQNYGTIKPQEQKVEGLQINIMNRVGAASEEKEQVQVNIDPIRAGEHVP